MGSGDDIRDDHDDTDVVDDDNGGGCDSGGGGKSSDSVSCSVCLETVTDNGDRSWANLRCRHRFHLDCIGSAFNAKGAMQCPNCRKIEKGQWLYANGSRSFPEFNMEDWTYDEELYDLGYSEMSFGVHWCPFGGVARLPPPFEDGEFSSSSYHDLSRQHAMFSEQAAIPSAIRPSAYLAYLGPVHPSSSNSGGNVPDAFNISDLLNGPSVHGEVLGSYAFPSMAHHYPNGEHHISQAAAQPHRNRFGVPGSASIVHPLASLSSNTRIGSYPGIHARNQDRVQALQAYYQRQHQPSGSPAPPPRPAQVVPIASPPDRPAGLFSRETQTRFPNPSHMWDGDSQQGSFYRGRDGSEPGVFSSRRFRHR